MSIRRIKDALTGNTESYINDDEILIAGHPRIAQVDPVNPWWSPYGDGVIMIALQNLE